MNPDSSHSLFTVISISFEKADSLIRGKFSFFAEQVEPFSKIIKSNKLGKSFILSTCNRTEIYCYSQDYIKIIKTYCSVINVSYEEFCKYSQVYKSEEAVNHIFRVASGLESQILGDFEIISQIKTWYKRFNQQKTTNYYLERIVNTAIYISKKVKSKTAISSGASSVSYASVYYILNKIQDIQQKKILIIGMGEIGVITLENLIKHINNNQIKVINRTENKAIKIAEKYNISFGLLSNLKQEVNDSDIIIVATSAQKPIITKDFLDTNKKRYFIDLSVPENVDSNIKLQENNILVSVDDLSKLIQQTLENRKSEIPKALKIIEENKKDFDLWLEQRKFVPIFKSLKKTLSDIQKKEYKKVINQDPKIKNKLIEKSAQRITNRFAEFINNNPNKSDIAIEILSEVFKI